MLLLLHIYFSSHRFDLDPVGWTPRKLDVEVAMPETVDLSALGTPGGLRPGEEPMPKGASSGSSNPTSAPPSIVPDEAIVRQLVEMGFDANGCRKAAFHTKNAGLEPAVGWVMDHMADADFAAPFVPPQDK